MCSRLLYQWRATQSRRPARHCPLAATACASLCGAARGRPLCILGFTSETDETARLRELGLHEGARVCVLRDGDPLLVRVSAVARAARRGATTNSAVDLAVGAGSSRPRAVYSVRRTRGHNASCPATSSSGPPAAWAASGMTIGFTRC